MVKKKTPKKEIEKDDSKPEKVDVNKPKPDVDL